MSTFTVTSTPTTLYQGNEQSISVVNDGPNTVYLGSDTSVSPLNGFALPPTGQMTWDGHVPLYAVTALGESRVFTDKSGDLSITTRASYYRRLAPPVQQSNGPLIIETGFLNTILIALTAYDVLAFVARAPAFADIDWMDGDRNITYSERVWWNGMDLATTANVQIPVKGAYASISIGAQTTNPFIYDSWIVYGTDRILPARSWDSEIAALPFSGSTAVFTRTNDTVYGTGVKQVDISGGILIPSLGPRIRIGFHGAITGAGQQVIADADTGGEFGMLDMQTSDSPRIYNEFAVSPTSALVYKNSSAVPTTGGASVVLSFIQE